MDDFKRKLIQLHHSRDVGWKKIYELLKRDPKLDTLTCYPQRENSTQSILSSQALKDFHSTYIQEQIRQYSNQGIKAITIFDEEYPELLKQIYQPPWVLYVKGDLSLLTKNPKLAVVGSRQASQYSHKSIDILFPELIKKDIVIVSGLASGVDTIAHQKAIYYHGQTIGVIAGGFYHIYPKENKKLASEMMQRHLVMSEYPPHSKPEKWQFPMRNRIISGMSQGTLIVEAKRKSGSLITANFAVNEGRDVFALPGNILSPLSIGTNELIQQGAKLVIHPNDILEEFF